MWMPGYFVNPQCPRCERDFDTHCFGIYSGLGPPAIRCKGCRVVVATDRVEWREMSTRHRVRYVSVSLLYMVVLGFLGGTCTRMFCDFLETGPWEDTLKLRGTGFVPGIVAWALAALGIQAWRIVASNNRYSRQAEPARIPWWALDFWMQIKVGLTVFGFAALGWLISLLVHG
jgi:hypothetical protein